MSKKNTKTTLIIVESPAKCNKFEEYLGPGYKCVASYGHLRTISSLKDIDIGTDIRVPFCLLTVLYKVAMEINKKTIGLRSPVNSC